MFCGRDGNVELNGLSKFDKEKLIEVCKYTLKLVKKRREKEKRENIRSIARRLHRRATGWRKYLPWNWGIKRVTKKICLDEIYADGWGPGWLFWWGKNEDAAETILKLCEKSDSNAIYLTGNDVDKLVWPKKNDGEEENS